MDRLNRTLSISTSVMFRLNIIRQALNFGQDMQLTENPSKSYIYCSFITKVKGFRYYKDEIDFGAMEIIGEEEFRTQQYCLFSWHVLVVLLLISWLCI